MIRQSSLDAFIKIQELLPKKRGEVYIALAEHGPCTANELFRAWKNRNNIVQANLHARLGELRDQGVVTEFEYRQCHVTGEEGVIVWKAIPKEPIKFDKAEKEKCKACDGKGFIRTQQGRLF